MRSRYGCAADPQCQVLGPRECPAASGRFEQTARSSIRHAVLLVVAYKWNHAPESPRIKDCIQPGRKLHRSLSSQQAIYQARPGFDTRIPRLNCQISLYSPAYAWLNDGKRTLIQAMKKVLVKQYDPE
jgi:hypothetical protein